MVYSPNSLSNGKNYEPLGVRDTIFSDKTMGEDLRVAGIATTILGVRILPGLSDGPTHGFLLTNLMNLNLKYVTLTHSIHSLYIPAMSAAARLVRTSWHTLQPASF
jgi:hypothetical protein